MPAATSAAVFELGMSRAREIGSLVDLVRPDVALVTSIAPAHLEHFGSLDRIAEAKAEIFEGLKQGGTALIPSTPRGRMYCFGRRRPVERHALSLLARVRMPTRVCLK